MVSVDPPGKGVTHSFIQRCLVLRMSQWVTHSQEIQDECHPVTPALSRERDAWAVSYSVVNRKMKYVGHAGRGEEGYSVSWG